MGSQLLTRLMNVLDETSKSWTRFHARHKEIFNGVDTASHMFYIQHIFDDLDYCYLQLTHQRDTCDKTREEVSLLNNEISSSSGIMQRTRCKLLIQSNEMANSLNCFFWYKPAKTRSISNGMPHG